VTMNFKASSSLSGHSSLMFLMGRSGKSWCWKDWTFDLESSIRNGGASSAEEMVFFASNSIRISSSGSDTVDDEGEVQFPFWSSHSAVVVRDRFQKYFSEALVVAAEVLEL